jgi:hypothetical protein
VTEEEERTLLRSSGLTQGIEEGGHIWEFEDGLGGKNSDGGQCMMGGIFPWDIRGARTLLGTGG